MANYGELLGCYDPQIEDMYRHFDEYFNFPTMFKIKNVGGMSMYMSKLYCLLNKECRYIITFVTEDNNSEHTKIPLKNLEWVSLQTRSMIDDHNLPPHSYHPKAKGPLNKKIVRNELTEQASMYECEDLPILVTLLHLEPSENNIEYQKSGTVIAALESFQTIITIK